MGSLSEDTSHPHEFILSCHVVLHLFPLWHDRGIPFRSDGKEIRMLEGGDLIGGVALLILAILFFFKVLLPLFSYLGT